MRFKINRIILPDRFLKILIVVYFETRDISTRGSKKYEQIFQKYIFYFLSWFYLFWNRINEKDKILYSADILIMEKQYSSATALPLLYLKSPYLSSLYSLYHVRNKIKNASQRSK